MKLLFGLFAAGFASELLLYSTSFFWRMRKVLVALGIVCNGLACGILVLWRVDLWSVLLVFIMVYRLFNNFRVIQGRMHEAFLRRATRHTAMSLVAMQVAIALLWTGWGQWHHPSLAALWLGGTALECVAGVTLLVATVRQLRRSVWPTALPKMREGELPTITVAIPARNETEDLQICLESIIASNYPKLEIIVLDDRSQLRRTPEIIRSFAHDGVRFVLGDEPDQTWLPKNLAYAKLVREASGQLIVFCGADVRFAPDTLRQLVDFMQDRNKQMVSILPEREQSARARFALIQAERYWWELALPRRFFNRPPVLSTFWAIDAQALHKAGGFQAVSRSIVPEAYFAKRLLAQDGYSFMRAGQTLGVTSAKQAPDQRDTAVRMRYPQLHRRPENVCITVLSECGLLLLPFVLVPAGFWIHSMPIAAHLLALAASVLLLVGYALIAVSVSVHTWLLGFISMPFAMLVDLGLLHYSMWRYEFSTVEWKGRNISLPAMHVIPHLPEI